MVIVEYKKLAPVQCNNIATQTADKLDSAYTHMHIVTKLTYFIEVP